MNIFDAMISFMSHFLIQNKIEERKKKSIKDNVFMANKHATSHHTEYRRVSTEKILNTHFIDHELKNNFKVLWIIAMR